jgi:antitoxin HicB
MNETPLKKNIDYYLGLPYTIELIQEPLGGYYVGIKELKGCMTTADDSEVALSEIQELMKEWLEIALEENLPIPEPRGVDQFSGKFNLRIPKTLHRQLIEAAEDEGVSLNQYCNYILAESVGSYQAPKNSPE